MYWVNTMALKLSCIEPTKKFVPAHFALIIIIIIVVHVVIKINTCRRQEESLVPENDAGFLKVIIIAAVHVAS